jgi:hypothetical protein
MQKKLNIRWSRGAGKTMRSKLRQADLWVSEIADKVHSHLELVVRVGETERRIRVPSNYLLVAPADAGAIAHLIERE